MLARFGPGKLTDHGRRHPAARGLAMPAGPFKPIDMRYRSRCEGCFAAQRDYCATRGEFWKFVSIRRGRPATVILGLARSSTEGRLASTGEGLVNCRAVPQGGHLEVMAVRAGQQWAKGPMALGGVCVIFCTGLR